MRAAWFSWRRGLGRESRAPLVQAYLAALPVSAEAEFAARFRALGGEAEGALWLGSGWPAAWPLDRLEGRLPGLRLAAVDVGALPGGAAPLARLFDLFVASGFEPLARDGSRGERGHVLFARGAAAALNAAALPENAVPVLVPCFNNKTYAARMLRQLRALGFSDITFVDNASSEPAMRGWLEEVAREAKVERLAENLGPRASIFTPARLAALPRRFCVTDPDLDFNAALPPDFLARLAEIASRHRTGKAGFALDLSRRARFHGEIFDHDGIKARIWDWEAGYWACPLGETPEGDRYFRAPIDTTFALYDQAYFRPAKFARAIRVAGRFTAAHLPWNRESIVPPEEDEAYRRTQKFSHYAVSA
jgi:hypothetical protein